MKIVVPKLQSLILIITRRDEQFGQCFVPSLHISPYRPKMIWIYLLLSIWKVRWNKSKTLYGWKYLFAKYLISKMKYQKFGDQNFSVLLPIFKNSLFSKKDKEDNAEGERIMSQLRKMVISSFILQTGTLVTALVLFYLQLWLVVRKKHRFIECHPKKCFNSFVQ